MLSTDFIKLIVIAPIWLQPSTAILLEADEELLLLATFKSTESYLSFNVIADVVLLFTERNDPLAHEQVKHVLSASERTKCIAVIHDLEDRELMVDSGASEVLLMGASPRTIVESIKRVAATSDENASE